MGVPMPHEGVKERVHATQRCPCRERDLDEHQLVAGVLVGLATGTTLYLSQRGEALKVNKSTSTIRASDSSWHPGLAGRPLSMPILPATSHPKST